MSALQNAQDAWGETLPDWVRELAVRCDQASQREVARQLEYSPAVVNRVLHRTWTASLDGIEAAVRRAWLAGAVVCPVLGEIDLATCDANQARPFSTSNSCRVRLYRACRDGCPHSRLGDAAHARH